MSETGTPIFARELMTDAARSPVPVTVMYLSFLSTVSHPVWRTGVLSSTGFDGTKRTLLPPAFAAIASGVSSTTELTVVDEGDAVTQSLRFIHKVSHQYHCDATVPDALYEMPTFRALLPGRGQWSTRPVWQSWGFLPKQVLSTASVSDRQTTS